MRQYTGNPYADFLAHDAEQEEWLEKLPRCSECDEPIQDECAYYINGEWICEECMDTYKRMIFVD